MNPHEIFREYFPDASDELIDFTICEHTGEPSCEECFRRQLKAIKDGKIIVKGKSDEAGRD